MFHLIIKTDVLRQNYGNNTVVYIDVLYYDY